MTEYILWHNLNYNILLGEILQFCMKIPGDSLESPYVTFMVCCPSPEGRDERLVNCISGYEFMSSRRYLALSAILFFTLTLWGSHRVGWCEFPGGLLYDFFV
ncbi:MAG: hypothetical protein D3910_28020, partial [Candidatus Electrothrix sp. ATG2]|nr:hypothetical protein [Candidatus Electrothrix sp. ATG2]